MDPCVKLPPDGVIEELPAWPPRLFDAFLPSFMCRCGELLNPGDSWSDTQVYDTGQKHPMDVSPTTMAA
jgi:hypothetical protein